LGLEINERLLTVQLLREQLRQGETAAVIVNGRSMYPLLQPHDLILLESVSIETLQIGEIITTISEGHLLTHRFWGFEKDVDEGMMLRTRGDRLTNFDPLCHNEDLVGRVIARKRHGQTLCLKTGLGRILHQHLTRLAQSTRNNCKETPFKRFKPRNKIADKIINRLIYEWSHFFTNFIGVISQLFSRAL
jgi:signal peptidase I